MKEVLLNKTGEKVYEYFNRFVKTESEDALILSTTNEFNILNHSKEVKAIINLSLVNNIRFINKFFESANEKINTDGIFIVSFETITTRKERQSLRSVPIISTIWFSIEFIFLRVAPKIWGLKKIYFFITRGRNQLLSKAEVMGRLVSCGFEIIDEQSIEGIKYVVTKKIKEPDFNTNASYGPLFKMERIGKEGKRIGVYKFRTMHPYAEYLQGYVLNLNGYAETGKPKNDFRLTPWGRILRKYWLDELPQLINILKGDLKLVGVRPVSETYLKDIPEDFLKMRLNHKPGCIPPYVALNMKSDVESVLEAEKIYIGEKIKHPYTTDTKYFFKAIFNILIRRKRSA